MLFISPPFSNYINLPYTKSIKGSFTLQKRNGLILQTITTLRYSFKYNGWQNKIGLRNKGIDWAINKYYNKYNKQYFKYYQKPIISIAILNNSDIDTFLQKIPDNIDLEINISCPNLDHLLVSNNIHKFLNSNRKWCSIKLSPTTNIKLIDKYYNQGFRIFHCTNTYPTKNGGISGPYLISYTTNLIKLIKNKYPDVEIIAGGGINNINMIHTYNKIGANHYSISTILFNPFKFIIFYFDWLLQKNKKII